MIHDTIKSKQGCTMEFKFSNIEDLLEKLKAAKHIYIPDLDWIDPVGITILKQYKVSNSEVNVSTSGKSHVYIDKLLHDSRDSIQDHLPLEHFDDHTNNIDEINTLLTQKILENAENLSPENKEDLSEYLKYMISEMMVNVVSHSRSQHGGFVAAQYYKEDNKVQVVIVDGGVGFLTTLSDHFDLKSEAEAIEKALEKEVTGSNRFSPYSNVPKHAGLGLFFLSKILEATQGKLIMISNRTVFRYPENTFQELDTSFRGTVIAFEIYENNLEDDLNTVLGRIRSVGEEYDDEDVF